MTRPSEKCTSLDIAEDVRRREALGQDFDRGMLARLAEGFERMEREPPRSAPYWPFAVGFLLATLLAVAVAGAPAPADLPTGPGWEAACKGGC